MSHNRETVVEELHNGICTVSFTKVNGESRTMHCTLNPAYAPTMPEQLHETGETVTTNNSDTVAVWDTDVNSWRSFRLDSIVEFNSPTILNG